MRMTVAAGNVQDINSGENEIAELGEECARVLLLLQQLAKARAMRRDSSEILGELSAAVLHLHAHTRDLDELIDRMASD